MWTSSNGGRVSRAGDDTRNDIRDPIEEEKQTAMDTLIATSEPGRIDNVIGGSGVSEKPLTTPPPGHAALPVTLLSDVSEPPRPRPNASPRPEPHGHSKPHSPTLSNASEARASDESAMPNNRGRPHEAMVTLPAAELRIILNMHARILAEKLEYQYLNAPANQAVGKLRQQAATIMQEVEIAICRSAGMDGRAMVSQQGHGIEFDRVEHVNGTRHVPRPSVCRHCNVEFPSRNRLMAHLRENRCNKQSPATGSYRSETVITVQNPSGTSVIGARPATDFTRSSDSPTTIVARSSTTERTSQQVASYNTHREVDSRDAAGGHQTYLSGQHEQASVIPGLNRTEVMPANAHSGAKPPGPTPSRPVVRDATSTSPSAAHSAHREPTPSWPVDRQAINAPPQAAHSAHTEQYPTLSIESYPGSTSAHTSQPAQMLAEPVDAQTDVGIASATTVHKLYLEEYTGPTGELKLDMVGPPWENAGRILFQTSRTNMPYYYELGQNTRRITYTNPQDIILFRNPYNVRPFMQALRMMLHRKKNLVDSWKAANPDRAARAVGLLANPRDDTEGGDPLSMLPRISPLQPDAKLSVITYTGSKGDVRAPARLVLARGYQRHKGDNRDYVKVYLDVCTGQATSRQPGDIVLPETEEMLCRLWTFSQGCLSAVGRGHIRGLLDGPPVERGSDGEAGFAVKRQPSSEPEGDGRKRIRIEY